jgi:AP-1 complex subunit gamma-1
MGYAPEHDVSGIADPFLQVKLLHVLRLLGRKNAETSDAMNDILAQVATNTETAKNAGNAILYECVQTIMQIESEGGLRVLAVNILGRFLLNRDNNIRYVALNTLSKVVTEDVQAVQRHRNTIVDCLKDPDVSIRTRALELIYALANESNIRTLAREMLNYLVVCSAELKPDLCSKIADVVDRFAPSKRWQIDTLITTLSIAGNNLENDRITSSLICLIAQCTQLHSYIVHKLYQAIQDDMSQQGLVHVSIWCCGEYGQLLLQEPPADENLKDDSGAATASQVIDLISKAMRLHSATELTKSFSLNALLKLTSRLGDPSVQARLLKLIGTYQHSMKLELQQRSVEYKVLLQPEWASLKTDVLAQMPIIDEEKMRQRQGRADSKKSSLDSDDEDGPSGVSVSISAQAPAAAAPAAPPVQNSLLDLDDIFGANPAPAAAPTSAPANDLLTDIFAAPAPMQPAQPAAPAGGGLLDLMATPSMPPAQAAPQTMMPAAAPAAPGAFQVYDKNGLSVSFSLQPNAQTKTTKITATFTNSTAVPMTGLLFQCAVPKYITLQMSPASSSEVPPNRSGTASQIVTIQNTMQGQKSVMMRLKIQFSQNGQVIDDLAQVSNFPPHL